MSLEELIARTEEESNPAFARQLELDILAKLGVEAPTYMNEWPILRSIDSAVALVEKLIPDALIGCSPNDPEDDKKFGFDNDIPGGDESQEKRWNSWVYGEYATAKTLPLAICLALLKALHAQASAATAEQREIIGDQSND